MCADKYVSMLLSLGIGRDTQVIQITTFSFSVTEKLSVLMVLTFLNNVKIIGYIFY